MTDGIDVELADALADVWEKFYQIACLREEWTVEVDYCGNYVGEVFDTFEDAESRANRIVVDSGGEVRVMSRWVSEWREVE